MALYEHREVVDTPQVRTAAVARNRRFSPGQVISGVLGFVLVVMGVVAVTRCGIDSSLNRPVTDILGLTHSSWVGIVEIVAGLLLIIGSADESFRGVAGAVGVLLFLGGIVVAAGTDKMLLQIGTERATGWFALFVGALAIVASMIPTFLRSERYVASDGQAV
jgi:membrane-bound ClpP family serine protease